MRLSGIEPESAQIGTIGLEGKRVAEPSVVHGYMPTPLEQQILDTTTAELIPNTMLQGDGKTVESGKLEGTQPDTKLVVTVVDVRPGKTPQWVVAYPIWDGTWMQSGAANPVPDVVASIVFSDLLDS